MDLEIDKIVTVSTGHVSKETAAMLEAGTVSTATFAKGEYGWFVYAGSYDENLPNGDTMPAELGALINLAGRNGCVWLVLDCDGPILEGFPTFDW